MHHLQLRRSVLADAIDSMQRFRLACFATVFVSLCSAPAFAQEFYVSAGLQNTKSLDEQTYSFSYEYLHNLSEHFYASFTWLNEGHVTNHHRDGHSGQIWVRWPTPTRSFVFSGGIGPYRYYDTTMLEGSTESTDDHGWGILYSAAAQWYFRAPWVLQLRYNYAHTTASISTDTLQLGIGYQFDFSSRPGPIVPAASYDFSTPERNEISAMIGGSIVNNFQSPHGAAWAIEYRRRLTPFIDVTATAIDEGDTGVVKRRGLAGAVWLMREFLGHRADVGLGLGPYFTYDENETETKERALGLFTMVIGGHWSEHWDSRIHWYRTFTTNGRDTDVILVSTGYSF